MSDAARPIAAGIDLGGTKIEAMLFGADMVQITSRRRPTPRDSYDDLLSALEEEVCWLRAEAGRDDLPVGMGFPGLVDSQTEIVFAGNLASSGRPLSPDLRARVGGIVVCANDSRCFTLSEAHGGAGKDHARVFGLIFGTGLGGGFCQDGRLIAGLNGMAGEIGHYGISAHHARKYGLPILRCGCGRMGCIETLISGNGMARIAEALIGTPRPATEIAANLSDPDNARVFSAWCDLAAEVAHTIQLHVDPDCIVLGGGLSNIDGVDKRLSEALARIALPGVRLPAILKPDFGDSSGGRGAALLALASNTGTEP